MFYGERSGGIRTYLDAEARHARATGAFEHHVLVPGRSEQSPLIDYVSGKVPDEEMPPRAQRKRFPALSTDEVTLLRAWIDQGAEWPKDVLLTSSKIDKHR